MRSFCEIKALESEDSGFLRYLKAMQGTVYVGKFKEVRNMAGKESPLNVGVIKEKLDNGEVKVKGSKQPRKEHSVKGVNGNINDAEILAYLKTQSGDVTSTQIRDALGFTSRTQARRVLRRLAKAGQVKTGSRKVSDKRQIFTFGVA